MVGRTSVKDKRARRSKEQQTATATKPASEPSDSHYDVTQAQDTLLDDYSYPTDTQLQSFNTSQSPHSVDPFSQGDFPDDPFIHGYRDASSSKGSTDPNFASNKTLGFNFDLSNIDFNFDQQYVHSLVTSDPSQTFSTSIVNPTSPTHGEGVSRGPEQDLQQILSPAPLPDTRKEKERDTHVLALVEIVRSLEAQIEAKETAMDKVLHLNKMCLANLARIVAMEEGKMCTGCRALTPAALELIVKLYESSLAEGGVIEPNQSTTSTPPPHQTSNSALQFGVYQIDPEDQSAFRNQLFVKELNRSIQIMNKLNVQSYSDAIAAGNMNCGSVAWYNKMEQRAKSLVAKLGATYNERSA